MKFYRSKVNYDDFIGVKAIRATKFNKDSKSVDSIEIYNKTTSDVLRAINMYAAGVDITREFIMDNPNGGALYTMKNNAGVTAEGIFNIVGTADAAGAGAITNVIDGTSAYSLFLITNKVSMAVSNVSFKNIANKADDGSVMNASAFDIENAESVINMENVEFVANAGNAIYNKGTVRMTNVVVAKGSATIANSIYNDNIMILNGTNEFSSEFTNDANGKLTMYGINTFGSTFTNKGIVNIIAEASANPVVAPADIVNIFSTLNNEGQILTSVGSSTFTGNIINTGLISLGANDIISANVSGTGELKIHSESIDPDNAYITTLTSKGVIENGIKLTIEDTGVLAITGGTVNIDGDDSWVGTITMGTPDAGTKPSTLNITGITTNGAINATEGNINIISGNLTITDTDTVELAVNVDIQSAGQFTLEGTTSFELQAGDAWSGTVNLLDNSTFATAQDLVQNGTLTLGLDDRLIGAVGTTYTNKGLALVITGRQTNFLGTYEQETGSLTVYANGYNGFNGASFAGIKNITAGSATIYSNADIDYDSYKLGSNAQFTNYSTGGTINSDVVNFQDAATGAIATFDSVNPDERANYNLSAFTATGANTIAFKNSVVKLNDTDYSDATTYKLGSNTVLDVQDSKYTSYNFGILDTSLDGITSKIEYPAYNVDIDFTTVIDDPNATPPTAPIADTFTLGKGSKGVLTISNINMVNFDMDVTLGLVQIIKGEGVGVDGVSLALADNLANTTWGKEIADCYVTGKGYQVYSDTYIGTKGIQVAKYDNNSTVNDSIEIYIKNQDDVLRALNTFTTTEERSFLFKPASEPYYLTVNLGETTSGVLNIVGNKDGNEYVIDGKNPDGATPDVGYSMFILKNATTLNISDVTIQNAGVYPTTRHNASVIDMYNSAATANIKNVVFTSNEQNAIFANAGKINLTDVTFTEDAADGNNISVSGTATLTVDGTNMFGTSIVNSGSTAIFGGSNEFKKTLSNTNNGNMTLNETNIFSGVVGTFGGAIYNNGSVLTVNNGSVFTSNEAQQGGAIYVSGNKNVNINGTFGGETDATGDKGNKAELGGAIYITGGNNVTVAGLFSNNVATTNGGAIYTDSSFSIVANNSETVFTGNTANALSNAIYVNASTSVTIRMNATNNGTIRFDDAIQGANKYNIAINGDNYDDKVIFNNLIQNANISIDNITVAISAAGLDLTPFGVESILDNSVVTLNSGVLELNTVTVDAWTTKDASASNLVVNPNSQSIPYLTIANSKVNLSNENAADVTTNLCNDIYMGILNSNANNEFSIDVAFSSDYTINEDGSITYNVPSEADTITIASGSTGVVTLSNINFMNVDKSNGGVIQIIKGDYTGSTITLALGDNVTTEWEYTLQNDYVSQDGKLNVLFSDFIGTKNLVLAHTNTSGNIYDSIEIVSNKQDILAAANQYVDSTDRTFSFTDKLAKEVYMLIEDTGVTASGTMNVVGIANTKNKTYEDIIDANKHSMFVLANAGTTLNISNVTIQNAVANNVNTGHNTSVLDVVADDAVVNLSNVIFKSNAGNAIYNLGTVSLNNVEIAENGGNIVNEKTLNIVSGTNTISSLVTNNAELIIGTDANTASTNIFNSTVTNNSTIQTKVGATTTFNGDIVASDGSVFNLGGTDIINSDVSNPNDVAEFNFMGLTTVTQNSGLSISNISLNIKDASTLFFNGSEGIIDVSNNGNDTWTNAGIVKLENYTNPLDGTVIESNLLYTGADTSGSNGIINAISGRFELVSGVFDVLTTSTIADDVKVILTSGALAVNKSGINLAAEDVWSDNAQVMLADGVTFSVGAGLNDNSVLNLTENSKLLGDDANQGSLNANFVNNGATINVLVDESEAYKGKYTQTDGSLVIENDGNTKLGRVFGEYTTANPNGGDDIKNHSLKDIQGGSMVVTYADKEIDYGNVKLGSNTTLTNTTLGGAVNSELLSFGGKGAVATFISNDENAMYTLENIDSLANSTNTIVFQNSNVTLIDKSFKPASARNGTTSYEFNNSIVNLQNGNVAATPDVDAIVDFSNYYFASFSSNNSAFVLDVDLKKDVLKADTLEIMSVANPNSDNIITLSDLNFINVDQSNLGKILILRNKIDDVTLAMDNALATKTWEYYVDDASRITQDADGNDILQIKFTDFLGVKALRLANYKDDSSTNYDSIEIYNQITYDLLQQISHLDTPQNVEYRQFAFTADGQTYEMTQSLGKTGMGEYNITGIIARDGSYSVIDGTNNHYSMFELSEDTQMSVNNITFTKAGLNITTNEASVFDITNKNATVDLYNVKFIANYGYAINNRQGTVNMYNVVFDAPTKNADGDIEAANSIANYATIVTSINNGVMTNNIFNSEIKNFNGGIFEFHATDTISGAILNEGEMRFYGIGTVNVANDGSVLENRGTIKTAVGITGAGKVSNIFNREINNTGIIETAGNDVFNANINNTSNIFFGGNEDIAGVISGENGKIVIDTVDVAVTPVVNVNTNGEFAYNQTISLATGAKLNVNGGIVNLDGADDWQGLITINNGILNMSGIENNGEFVGNAGTVNIIENAVLNITNVVNDNVNVNLENGTISLAGTSPARIASVTLSTGDKWVTGTTSIVFGSHSSLTLDEGLNGDSSMVLSANQVSTLNDATSKATAKLNNMGVDLTIDGDNSGYAGKYYQGSNAAGTNYNHTPALIVTENGNTFSGIKYIYAGNVDIARSELIDYTGYRLGDNTQFINKSKGGIINSDVISFIGTGIGSVATFTNKGDLADSDKAEYTLNNITNTNPSNKIVIKNSDIVLASYDNAKNYYDYTGTTIYQFTNSNLDLSANDTNTIKDYQFTTLISDNTNNFTIDLDFGSYTVNADGTVSSTAPITADTFTLGANSNGVIKLSTLNYTSDNQFVNGKVTIINTASNNISLALTDELVNEFEGKHTYNISDAKFIIDDKVQSDYSEYLVPKYSE